MKAARPINKKQKLMFPVIPQLDVHFENQVKSKNYRFQLFLS